MLSKLKPAVGNTVEPLVNFLARIGVRPNHLTIVGLILGILASVFIAKANVILGALFVLFSSFCDLLDGALARTQNMVTKFGGFLDSVIDRYVDILIFISLGIYGVNWILVVVALSGALLVSYTRARAEHIIDRCDVGIAERGERLLIIFFGLITGYVFEAVLIVAVLSHITAIHRILYTYRKM